MFYTICSDGNFCFTILSKIHLHKKNSEVICLTFLISFVFPLCGLSEAVSITAVSSKPVNVKVLTQHKRVCR